MKINIKAIELLAEDRAIKMQAMQKMIDHYLGIATIHQGTVDVMVSSIDTMKAINESPDNILKKQLEIAILSGKIAVYNECTKDMEELLSALFGDDS